MVNRKDTALEFVDRFCAGDIEALAPLLAEDLRLSGPFHRFGSRTEYLQNLMDDPPRKCGYRILSILENGDEVCVFYDYAKDGEPMTVAQLCRFNGEQIGEILLVFDSAKAR